MASSAMMLFCCVAWIGTMSYLLVRFWELPHSTGWIIASLLGYSVTVAVAIISFEIRHAIDLTDDPGSIEWECGVAPVLKAPASPSPVSVRPSAAVKSTLW